MASTIKVDQIEGSTGSTVTVPTGQTLTLTDGLAVASLPTVTVAKGGTNLTSFTAGDVLYATGSTTLAKLPKGTAEQVLAMNAGATAPDWGSVDLTVLPTISVAKGGTNLSSFAAGDLLYATGSTTLAKLAKPASDKFLQNTSGGVLSWEEVSGAVVQRKIVHDTSTGTVASNTPIRWTNFNLSFTPTVTGNIIELELHDYWSSQSTQWGGYFYDQTNSVKIGVGASAGSRQRLSFINGISNSNSWVGFAGARAYYAAPNTNATDFAVYIGSHSNSTFYHNRNEQHTNNADLDNAYVTGSFTITEYASSAYTGSGQLNI